MGQTSRHLHVSARLLVLLLYLSRALPLSAPAPFLHKAESGKFFNCEQMNPCASIQYMMVVVTEVYMTELYAKTIWLYATRRACLLATGWSHVSGTTCLLGISWSCVSGRGCLLGVVWLSLTRLSARRYLLRLTVVWTSRHLLQSLQTNLHIN